LVLGLWRSGTTFLHELLAAHPALCTPRTWQCMAPGSFAIRGQPRTSARVLRPMDSFAIETDSPQEDELAMLMLGAPSLYRGWLDPRRLPELQAGLDPAQWAADWPGLADWQDFLARVQHLDGGQRRLLLKSPNHSFRMRGLLRLFPAAPCVWIVREPQATWLSNLKMWRAMNDVYGLASIPDGLLEVFLVEALRRAAQALDELRAALPPSQLVVLGLDDLQRRPVEAALAVTARWGLAPAGAEIDIAARGYSELQPTHYAAAEPAPQVQAALQTLARAQQAALGSHGL
jgi:hypothetical protein